MSGKMLGAKLLAQRLRPVYGQTVVHRVPWVKACLLYTSFIFGDKPAGCWNSLHIGAEFLSWKGQIFQTCEKCLRLVVMEAQQRTVFAVGVHEYLVLSTKTPATNPYNRRTRAAYIHKHIFL